MAIIKVNLTDTINGFRLKTNTLAEQVGDLATLDTSGGDSSVVAGINSMDSDMGRQADLNYRESSDSTFLTLVDAINRIVDSDGNFDSAMMPSNFLDSDAVLNHMIKDSDVQGYHFDAMTVLKIFASNGTELRKIYGPARFDNDSANTFRTNPWV